MFAFMVGFGIGMVFAGFGLALWERDAIHLLYSLLGVGLIIASVILGGI